MKVEHETKITNTKKRHSQSGWYESHRNPIHNSLAYSLHYCVLHLARNLSCLQKVYKNGPHKFEGVDSKRNPQASYVRPQTSMRQFISWGGHANYQTIDKHIIVSTIAFTLSNWIACGPLMPLQSTIKMCFVLESHKLMKFFPRAYKYNRMSKIQILCAWRRA